MILFTRDDLPKSGWNEYHKCSLTRARRVGGPFSVQTREGVITCEDGYLAVDSGGWPYPIAKDEFERIYVEADSDA